MRMYVVAVVALIALPASARPWHSAALEPPNQVLDEPLLPETPDLALPDPTMTPGEADTPREIFCRRPTKERRHLPRTSGRSPWRKPTSRIGATAACRSSFAVACCRPRMPNAGWRKTGRRSAASTG